MSAANKEMISRFGQVWGRGNPSILDELASNDIRVWYPLLPEPAVGIEAFKAVLAMVHEAFPDLDIEIGDLVAEGDVVVASWRLSGTHLGDLMGVPPSGAEVSWTGITIYQIKDGKVVDERGEEDGLGLLRQIGAIPEPTPAS